MSIRSDGVRLDAVVETYTITDSIKVRVISETNQNEDERSGYIY